MLIEKKIAGKAMIMSIDGQEMLIFTDDGDFLHVPVYRPDLKPGQTVSMDEINLNEISCADEVGRGSHRQKTYSVPQFFRSFYGRLAVACILAFFMLFGLLPNFQASLSPTAASAFVLAFDINPSFELYLDSQGKVVEYKPLNAEAEKLTFLKELTEKTWREAVELLVVKASQQGYLGIDKENLIVVSRLPMTDANVQESISAESLLDAVSHYVLQQQPSAQVIILQATKDDAQKAGQQKTSVNKVVLDRELNIMQLNPEDGTNAIEIPKDKSVALMGKVILEQVKKGNNSPKNIRIMSQMATESKKSEQNEKGGEDKELKQDAKSTGNKSNDETKQIEKEDKASEWKKQDRVPGQNKMGGSSEKNNGDLLNTDNHEVKLRTKRNDPDKDPDEKRGSLKEQENRVQAILEKKDEKTPGQSNDRSTGSR